VQEAIDYAHARGVLVVASTGNDGGSVLYPATCEHALAVAATDQEDARPGFSNHGPQVDVAAPGSGIYSTWYLGGYYTKSGTSMAAQHVSGLAALIWSARPDLTAEQVSAIITGTAADVNAGTHPGWDEYLGWGRVEAGRALSLTVHTGTLHLAASSPQLAVGESGTVTATVPLTAGTASWVSFTASGGTVSPALVPIRGGNGAGVATTTLLAGPSPGVAAVTGASGPLTGALSLRLLPGPVVSATLTPARWKTSPGSSITVTLTAADRYGNPPLDGTPVRWAASGGTIAPAWSPSDGGTARAAFTAGPLRGPATITASLGGFTAMVTIDVSSPFQHRYLPLILHVDTPSGP
jgi:hypothetical protein